MIAIIRIAGQVKIKRKIAETLDRLWLRQKFSCAIIDEKDKVRTGMLRKVENFVAFGKINKATLVRMIENRAEGIEKNKKIDAEKTADEMEKGKSFKELGLKPYFRLHPPRGGLKSSRDNFPRGVLGNHKEQINKLIERML